MTTKQLFSNPAIEHLAFRKGHKTQGHRLRTLARSGLFLSIAEFHTQCHRPMRPQLGSSQTIPSSRRAVLERTP
jgi:hypothetical protein